MTAGPGRACVVVAPPARSRRWSFNYFFYNKKKKRIILLTSSYINLLSPKLAGAVGTLDEDLEGLDNENDPDDERGPFRMDLEPPRRTSR